MKLNKGIVGILIAIIFMAAGLGTLSYFNSKQNVLLFPYDGYILNADAKSSTDETNTGCEQIYFAGGTPYKEKMGSQVLFRDSSEQSRAIENLQFIHYTDDSLGSFSKGVIMNLDALNQEQYGYYSITKNTILLKNGTQYEMSSRGEAMTMTEFLYKISDKDYMIVSPEITLHLGDGYEIILEDYVQLKYVDNGIVRIVHQQGTFQTVSEEAYLTTQDGTMLNLASKNFMEEGEPVLSLDSIALNDTSYLQIDENVEQPGIPTFNVVNGTDGISGISGEDGEEGESGEEGETGESGTEGDLGESGLDGDSGTSGKNGTTGNDGRDGVEGNTGSMGYDGAPGEAGVDGTREDEGSGVVATELYAQPTIAMKTDSYDVTAGSASMTLRMTDVDNSLTTEDMTIKLYDKATMQEITSFDGEAYEEFLRGGSDVAINMAGLSPNTEYVLQVVGSYLTSVDDITGHQVVLYNKTFTTNSLGVTLSKDLVTDTTIQVISNRTSSDVAQYDVVLYTSHDATGNPFNGTVYHMDATSASQVTSIFTDGTPEGLDVTSNTVYYACIQNVVLTGQTTPVDLDASVTEITLTTLKEKPYYQQSEEDGGAKQPVSYLVPTVNTNAVDCSISLEIPQLVDPDFGITGYRYELYKASELTAAMNEERLPVAAYTAESSNLKTQSFVLNPGDNAEYVGRVVVLFEDNEKNVEYPTQFSAHISQSGTSFPQVEFVDIQTQIDMISGYIKITDASGTILPYVSGTNPISLTITSEYDDVYTIKISEEVLLSGSSTNTRYYYFEQKGLRKNTNYAFSAYGPVDTDGDGAIATEEHLTHLAGICITTADNSGLHLGLVGACIPTSTQAFSAVVNLSSVNPMSVDGDDVTSENYEYQAAIMDRLVLQLVHITPTGEIVMGSDCIISDTDMGDHDSIFFSDGWLAADTVHVNPEDGTLMTSDYRTGNSSFILSPTSFGLNINDSAFYSGGTFVIRVKEATDYTAHDNTILFYSGEDLFSFTVEKKHVQANEPNNQVSVGEIANIDAEGTTHYRDDLDDDTTVGLRIQAKYPYSDATEITYYVYELNADATGTGNIYPSDNSYNPINSTIYGGGENVYAYDEANNQVGTLVCKTTITNLSGATNTATIEPIKLYFDDLALENPSNTGTADDYWIPTVSGRNMNEIVVRGRRYFVCYTVKTSNEVGSIDCESNSTADVYPYCTYNTDARVPYYRSAVISLQRQIPTVERYLWTTTANSQTWKYRITDPDHAIVLNSNGEMIAQLTRATTLGGTYETAVNYKMLPENYQTFNDLTFTGLQNSRYYKVTFSYKLTEQATTTFSISSAPVLFESSSTVPTIALRGQNSGTQQPAIVDQGGYRYRLTLRGNDITRYAALRVTLTGEDSNGNDVSVIYDPVYIEVQVGMLNEGSISERYGYAYLDTAAMQPLIEAGVEEATVTVQGYYNTYVEGVSGFTSTQDIGASKTNLDGENVFAIRMMNSNGEVYYTRLTSSGLTPVSSSGMETGQSLFVPGAAKGDGFLESGTFSCRYASTSMALLNSNYLTAISKDVVFDETGMRDQGSDTYYIVEKLALTDISFSISGEDRINIANIRPAVQLDNRSIGVKTMLLDFEAVGTGANSNSRIYAQVYEADSSGVYHALALERTTETREGETYTVYTAATGVSRYTTDPSDYYNYTNYGNNYIQIQPLQDGNGTTKFMLPISIRGLEADTTYRVRLFTFDSANERQELYSRDYSQTGYDYELKTKKNVSFTVTEPTFTYNSYGDKTISFGFAVSGDDGTGITVHYELQDEDGNVVIASRELDPIISGTLTYYPQLVDRNNRMVIPMTPGGAVELGKTYYLVVNITDNVGGTNIGNNQTSPVEVNTPVSLSRPSFTLLASTSEENDGSAKLDVTVTSQDSKYTTIDNSYLIEVIDNGTNTVVESTAVTKTAGNPSINLSSFSGLEFNKTYIVRVTAQVDGDNNAIADATPVISQVLVTTSRGASATLGGDATPQAMNLLLLGLNNFDTVDHMLYTVSVFGNAQTIQSGTIQRADCTEDATTITANINWATTQTAGTQIAIQVQFYDSDDIMLGNSSTVMTIHAQAASGRSVFSLFSSPVSNALTTASAMEDATGGASAVPSLEAATQPLTEASTVAPFTVSTAQTAATPLVLPSELPSAPSLGNPVTPAQAPIVTNQETGGTAQESQQTTPEVVPADNSCN